MKRRTFLASLAAAPAVALVPAFPLGAAAPGKGFVTATGAGRRHGHLRLQGVNANVLDVKVSGHDTAGGFAIFEQTSRSPKRGTPLHVHPHQDEVFHVLAGEYRFQVGGDRFTLRAGDTIFLPRNVPHAWTQVAPTGKMTVTVQPAGQLEEFFVAVAGWPREPTPAEMAQLFAAHDMQVLGPPLAVE